MASRIGRKILGIFFDVDGLAEVTADYKARIAEINANDAEVTAAISEAHARNKAEFLADIKRNTDRRNKQLATRSYS